MKNKQALYLVARYSSDDKEPVIVAGTETYERADELCGEYTQVVRDKGFTEEEIYFKVDMTFFYT